MTLPMLRILPHPWDFVKMSAPGRGGGIEPGETGKDKYESLRKLAMVQVQPPRNPNKPFTSFRINDILSERSKNSQKKTSNQDKVNNSNHLHRRESLSKLENHHLARNNVTNPTRDRCVTGLHNANAASQSRHRGPMVPPSRIVRPWDKSPSTGRNSEASSEADDEEINVDDDDDSEPSSTPSMKGVSPLDALMDLANKTFQGLETSEAAGKTSPNFFFTSWSLISTACHYDYSLYFVFESFTSDKCLDSLSTNPIFLSLRKTLSCANCDVCLSEVAMDTTGSTISQKRLHAFVQK